MAGTKPKYEELGRLLQHLRMSYSDLNRTELADFIEVSGSTVSRWEGGERIPPKAALDAISDVLRLPQSQVDALYQAAGYVAFTTEQRQEWQRATSEELVEIRLGVQNLPDELENRLRKVLSSANPWSADVGSLQPPLGFAAPARVARNSFPVIATESLAGALLLLARGSLELSALYILITIAAVLWFSGPRLSLAFRFPSLGGSNTRSIYIAELLFVSLIVVLNSPLLLAAYTRIDQYGFFLVGGLPDGGEFILAALVNVVIAGAATSTFYVLWEGLQRKGSGPLELAFGTVGPAILVAYIPAGLLSFTGLEVFFLIALFPLFLALITIVACSHPDLQLDEFIAKLTLQSALALIVLAFVLSSIALVLHITKTIEPVIPSEYANIIWSQPIDWPTDLGYAPADFIDRNIYGLTWMTAVDMFFLLAIPAPILLVTLYRTQYLPSRLRSSQRTRKPDRKL